MRETDSSTRKTLLTMLKTDGPLSVGELSRQLGITEMAVRRHMNTLERDGLVSATLVRRAMGRPTHRYALTERAETLFPSNYHLLVLDFLETLEAEEDGELLARLFDKRKRKLIGKYRERLEGDLGSRVEELTRIQNDNGYMADWEREEDGGYVINEYNCPIARVACRYGHACRSELEMFGELLGASVQRVECLANGGRKCKYVIRPKNTESGEAVRLEDRRAGALSRN